MKLKLDELSPLYKKLNPHLFGGAAQSPIVEPPVRHEPLGEAPREESHPVRIRVRVESFRGRLIDPDNLCPKYFIDCLRYAGLIPNDTAADIVLEVSQKKSGDERTEITVEPI